MSRHLDSNMKDKMDLSNHNKPFSAHCKGKLEISTKQTAHYLMALALAVQIITCGSTDVCQSCKMPDHIKLSAPAPARPVPLAQAAAASARLAQSAVGFVQMRIAVYRERAASIYNSNNRSGRQPNSQTVVGFVQSRIDLYRHSAASIYNTTVQRPTSLSCRLAQTRFWDFVQMRTDIYTKKAASIYNHSRTGNTENSRNPSVLSLPSTLSLESQTRFWVFLHMRTNVYAKKVCSICTDSNSQNLHNSIRQSSLSRYSVNAFCRESNATEYCVNDSSPHGQLVDTITDAFRGRHKAQSEAIQTQGDTAAKGAFSVEWLSSMTGPKRTLCSLSFHPAMFVPCLGREISLANPILQF